MMSATQYPKGPAFPGYPSNPPAPMMPQTNMPRPVFFISRSNGLLVPLVPADELPFSVRLQGLQRVMQIEQTYGMQYVGSAPYTGMTYKLEQDINTPMHRSTSQPPGGTPNGHARSQSSNAVNPVARYLAPDALARQALVQSASNAAAAASNRQSSAAAHETATSWRSNYQPGTSSQPALTKSGDKTQSLIDAILSSSGGAEEATRLGYVPKPSITPPSGALPDQDKKEYCTYWIRTGECDYTQQGCLYKHEMPDRATLGKIGFRTLPRWWAEKQMLMQGPGEQKDRTLVGPVLNASEWLKRKSDSEDSSSEESRSETNSRKSSVSSTQETVKEDQAEVKGNPERDRTSTLTACTASLALDCARKASTISDLIEFAVPSTPSPPRSSNVGTPVTPTLTPTNSTDTSPRMPSIPPTPICAKSKALLPTSTLAPEPVRVFVPRGENAEYHIAEATKKRAQQEPVAHRGATVSTLGAVKALDLQIQESQKTRSVKKDEKGLMASRHAHQAPAAAASGGAEAEQRGRSLEKDGPEKKRSPRTGCRPRRPAGSGGKGKEKARECPWESARLGKESPKMTIVKKGEVVGGAEKK